MGFKLGSLLAVALAIAPAAARAVDQEGCKDHPLVSRYPGSELSHCDVKEFDEFDLPVGPGGDWENKPPRSVRLEGKITRLSYALPENRSVLEVYKNYEKALSAAGFKTLHSCKGDSEAGCGSQFAYLHRFHGEGVGGEPDTRIITAKLSRAGGDVHVSFHVATGHVLLAVIESKAMDSDLVKVDAAALANDLERTGHASVYGILFDTGKSDLKPESDAVLKEIGQLMAKSPSLALHVVGHTDNVGGVDANLALSRLRAGAVVKALTTRFAVPASRLRPDGVGPLCPVASNAAEEGRAKNRRVELVKQ